MTDGTSTRASRPRVSGWLVGGLALVLLLGTLVVSVAIKVGITGGPTTGVDGPKGPPPTPWPPTATVPVSVSFEEDEDINSTWKGDPPGPVSGQVSAVRAGGVYVWVLRASLGLDQLKTAAGWPPDLGGDFEGGLQKYSITADWANWNALPVPEARADYIYMLPRSEQVLVQFPWKGNWAGPELRVFGDVDLASMRSFQASPSGITRLAEEFGADLRPRE